MTLEEDQAALVAQVDARLSGEPTAVVVHGPVAEEEAIAPLTSYVAMACDEAELKSAQQKMIAWTHAQQEHCTKELAEETEAYRIAKSRRWAVTRYRANMTELARRVTFYSKLNDALNDGYVIVPNFEMTTFAVRTEREVPVRNRVLVSQYHSRVRFPENSQQLASGEGEYKNPMPKTYRGSFATTDKDGKPVKQLYDEPVEFKDIAFPATLARPVLMERVSQAMQAKVFDEIGVAVDTQGRGARRGDPILLGRIRNPRTGRSDVTFFIGWYFDPTNV